MPTRAAIAPSLYSWTDSAIFKGFIQDRLGHLKFHKTVEFPSGTFTAEDLRNTLQAQGCDLLVIGRRELLLWEDVLTALHREAPSIPVLYMEIVIPSAGGEPQIGHIGRIFLENGRLKGGEI